MAFFSSADSYLTKKMGKAASQHAILEPLEGLVALDEAFGEMDVALSIYDTIPTKEAPAKAVSLLADKSIRLSQAPTTRHKNVDAQKLHKSRKLPRLSHHQAKSAGLFDIGHVQYQTFLHLNGLWNSYVTGLLGQPLPPSWEIANRLLTADYHGALVEVAKSACQSYIGQKGIIIKDSEQMISIINANSQVKNLIKAQTVFKFKIQKEWYYLHGKLMCTTPGWRSKLKTKFKSDLNIKRK
eukprot:Platyproteum_vivax@DN2127_c0_g1_i1.p1